MKRRLLLFALFALLLLASPSQIRLTQAASNGSIKIILSGPGYTDYQLTVTGTTDDDGSGNDFISVVCVNSNGTVSDVDIFSVPVGTTLTLPSDCDYEFGPAYNAPLTLELWDSGDPGSLSTENSPQGLAYARAGKLMATAGGGSTACINTDNRLNPCQGNSTVAVYCENGGVTVYAIYNSVGYLAFKINKDELAKFPEKPAKNTLIKQNLGARLYRLTTGELQVNRMGNEGKDYHFIWAGCN